MITIKNGADIIYCNACGNNGEVTLVLGREKGNFSITLCLCKACLQELALESIAASWNRFSDDD